SGAPGTSGASGATGAATTPAAPTTTSLCAGVTDPEGTVSITGSAPNVPAVSALIDALQKDTDLTVIWVTTAKVGETTLGTGLHRIDFSLTASLGHTARGHRLESFFKEAKCK